MPWPTPQEYNEAIQHPGLCFEDVELRSGMPDLTPLGLPRPITGNFASVYRVRASGDWAVRCFFREFADSGERYAAISAHLAAARLPHMVGFEYLQRGIRVGGTWFPVLKMQWVEGALLGDFVAQHRHDAAVIRDLANRWLEMLNRLEGRSIAHGDLQHGNVLVVGGTLRLVDYDGMYVPALGGRISHELGHPNYQHPLRTGIHFGAGLDRFSGWIIYLSLLALQRSPDLWDDLSAGDECLLFRRFDFEAPDRSATIARLRAESGLRPIAEQVERLLALPPLHLPPVAPLEPGGRRPQSRPAVGHSTLPEWVAESIPPTPPRRFVWPASLPRVMALITAVATLAVLVAASLTPAEGGALALAAEGCALWLAYATDPAVMERLGLRGRRLVAGFGVIILNAEERLEGSRMTFLDGRHTRLQRRLAGSRDAIAAGHKATADMIVELLEPRGRRLAEDVTELGEARRTAEARVLEALDQRRVERALRSTRILTARIAGLSLPARVRLWLAGVRNARHVGPERVIALQRLHPTQAAAVLRWRVETERRIRAGAAPVLPLHIRRLLDIEYGRRLKRLQRQVARLERRADVLQQHAQTALGIERQRLEQRSARATRRHDRAHDRHGARLASLALKRERLLTDMGRLDERAYILRDLTFRAYLAAVFGLGRLTRS
jgi:hypothetical protein